MNELNAWWASKHAFWETRVSQNKHRHSRNQPKDALADVKNKLRGMRQPRAVLSNARATVDPALFPELIGWVSRHPELPRQLFCPLYPRAFDRVYSVNPLSRVDVKRELQWARAYLVPHALRIRDFVELNTQFHKAVLSGNDTEASAALDAVEVQFGHSIWLTKKRIALLQMTQGLEAQKSYFRSLVGAGPEVPLASYIAYSVSVRNEATITPNRFAKLLSGRLSEADAADHVKTFIRYHLLPGPVYSADKVCDILRMEATGPVVDYYEGLVRVAIDAASDVRSALSRLIADILIAICPSDQRLSTLLFELGAVPPRQRPGDTAAISAYDNFLHGDYTVAANTALQALKATPDHFDLVQIAAQSLAALPETSAPKGEELVFAIVRRMSSLIAKSRSADEDAAELFRIGLNLGSQQWADSLLCFVHSCLSSSVSDHDGAFSDVSRFVYASFHPMRIRHVLDEYLKSTYAKEAHSLYGDVLGLRYCGLGQDPDAPELAGLSSCARLLQTGENAYLAGQFARAAELARLLQDSTPLAFYRHQATRLMLCALLEMGEIRQCLVAAASAIVRDRQILAMLPVETIVDALTPEATKTLGNEISLAIMLDVHGRLFNNEFKEQLDYAYEDVLASFGLDRPSKMRDFIQQFDKDKLIYFLRYVCVEAIMDLTPAFDTSKDVAEERLAVCKLLADIDPGNADAYHAEIKDIYQRLVVHKGLRNVEQSKIYVDVESVRAAVMKSLRETFSRYMSYVKNGLGGVEDMQSVLDQITTRDPEKPLVLRLPSNEALDILTSMVVEVRDQYVSGSGHGLNSYLSVRIRHGTLSGQLRSPLEARQLVTKKMANTAEYKPNHYWPDTLSIQDESGRSALAARLGTFTMEFDNLVQTIVGEWIQVKTDSSGRGLFDFTLTRLDVLEIAGRVTVETTLDEFLATVMSYLDDMLQERLQGMRKRLETEVKPSISGMLVSLQKDIESIAGSAEARELTNAIRSADTELQNTVDRISEWFRLVNTASAESYRLDDIIGISELSVKLLAPGGFTAKTSIQEDLAYVLVYGRQMTSFVDVFFTIFENISRHAQVGAHPAGNVEISADSSLIHVRVENELGRAVDRKEVQKRLDAIKKGMVTESQNASIAREGGTGFYKMRRILSHDLGALPHMAMFDFGISDQDRFFVQFSVPFHRIIEVQEENDQ